MHLAQGGCIDCHCNACVLDSILTECLDPSIYMFRRGEHPEMEEALKHLNIYALCRGTTLYQQIFARVQTTLTAISLKFADNEVVQKLTSQSGATPGQCIKSARWYMADPRWLDVNCDANDTKTTVFVILGTHSSK